MLGPDALHIQLLSQLVQSSVQVGAELHQILHVEDYGKIQLAQPHQRMSRVTLSRDGSSNRSSSKRAYAAQGT